MSAVSVIAVITSMLFIPTRLGDWKEYAAKTKELIADRTIHVLSSAE